MRLHRRGAAFGHAARVAAVATGLIAVVYVIVGGILDAVDFHRLTSEVDQRVHAALTDRTVYAAGSPGVFRPTTAHPRDLDDAPIVLWRVGADGRATALTPGAPALPQRAWTAWSPVTVPLDSGRFRLQGRPLSDGTWLVAGESLAGVNHIRSVLLVTEAVVAPVILLAIYLGSLAIGLKASAPVEATRRRQLEFTADASHELRTPLSVIEAEVGLALSSRRDGAYYRSALERVAGESRRLRRIVDDLLWLSRFDSEPSPPGDEPVDVVTIAETCTDRFRNLAESRGLTLAVRAEGEAPALIKAPPEWVDRLLGVLVDNACRYSPPGGTVQVTARSAGPRVHLIVEDDGPGIPETDRDRLFDRFHRASDEPGGAGLGLAIADSVVRATGGRWNIGSSPGGGGRMEVSWHRAGGAERAAAPPPAPPVSGPPAADGAYRAGTARTR